MVVNIISICCQEIKVTFKLIKGVKVERQTTGQEPHPKHSEKTGPVKSWLQLPSTDLVICNAKSLDAGHCTLPQNSCPSCHWKPDAAAIAAVPWPEQILRHPLCFESPALESKSREDASAWLHQVLSSQMLTEVKKGGSEHFYHIEKADYTWGDKGFNTLSKCIHCATNQRINDPSIVLKIEIKPEYIYMQRNKGPKGYI